MTRVTDTVLIEALPVNEWFAANSVNLDMSKDSIRNRLKKMPLVNRKLALCKASYFLTKENKQKLLVWAKDSNPYRQSKPLIEQDNYMKLFLNT